MRFIQPSAGGNYHLDNAHANPPTTDVQAKSRWSSFGHKNQLLQTLHNDQYGLCCYSELRADQEGLGYHIEHIQPKTLYPVRTFDYSNLAASALTSKDLTIFNMAQEETFGGHAKGSQYDAVMFISCHDADCALYFSYLSDGRVVPSVELNQHDTERAHYTIDVLKLNCSYLTNRRRRRFEELDNLFEEHHFKNWSLHDLACIELMPTERMLNAFFSLTRQFFGPLAESVLQQHAPN